jgi:hypothetical protein
MKATAMCGRVRGLYLGLDARLLLTSPCDQVTATFTGLAGDKHAGYTRPADARTPHYSRGTEIRNDRQVSIVSMEDLAEIAKALDLPQVRAEWLGANICLSEIPNFTHVPPFSRLIFSSGAVLSVSYENHPCTGPGKVIQARYADRTGLASAFPKAALHRRGLVACVELPGLIRITDTVTLELAQPTRYQP